MVIKGYTLIELTVVVGLLAILSVGISSVVLLNTVSVTRTRNLTHVRESGDFALNQLKQLIRNAKTIKTCNNSTNELTLVNQDGGYTKLLSEDSRIASNSGIYLTPSDISITSFGITCLPDETTPSLVKLIFTAQLAGDTSVRTSPTLNFETSISLRNANN